MPRCPVVPTAYPQNIEDHHTDGAMNHLEAKADSALKEKVEEQVAEVNMQQAVSDVAVPTL